MPPTGKLASGDIAAVERWIRLGAPLPGEAVPSSATAADRADGHWAFARPQRPAPPAKIGGLGVDPDRPLYRSEARRRGTGAVGRGGPPDAHPPRVLRPARTAAEPARSPRLCRGPPRPAPMQRWSTACWRPSISASAGRGIGSTWRVTPTKDSRRGRSPSRGPTAIGSLTPSTTTCLTTVRDTATRGGPDRGRPAASRRPGFLDRGHQPSPPHGRSGKPGRQNRRRDARVSGAVGGLRALPRSQIRPHSAEGLLFPLQHFSELAGRARADSDRRHARRRRGAVFQRKAENAPRVDRRIPPRAAGLAHTPSSASRTRWHATSAPHGAGATCRTTAWKLSAKRTT